MSDAAEIAGIVADFLRTNPQFLDGHLPKNDNEQKHYREAFNLGMVELRDGLFYMTMDAIEKMALLEWDEYKEVVSNA